jgi:hypothetical protein
MTLYPADPKLGLNNITIGGDENHRVGGAFKAHFSSPLAAIRSYRMWAGVGYAAGNIGRYRYELCSDNAGKPGASIAVGFEIEDPQYPQPSNNKGGFPLIGFPSFPVLKKGTWYHFVMTNIDLQPTINWSSFNSLLAKGAVPGTPGPNPDPDSFVEYYTNGVWTKYPTMMAEPFGVFYANGELQGNGGYEIQNGVTACGSAYGFGKLC